MDRFIAMDNWKGVHPMATMAVALALSHYEPMYVSNLGSILIIIIEYLKA